MLENLEYERSQFGAVEVAVLFSAKIYSAICLGHICWWATSELYFSN